MGKNIAIVGATGAVGLEIIKILFNRNFPIKNLKLIASSNSKGKKINFSGKSITVEELNEKSFKNIDIAFFSAGSSLSKKYAKIAVESGALVIDNSSAFRMVDNVPLVVPEINPESAFSNKGIISNPNCSTIQMVMALNPIHKVVNIKRVVVATYQAVSGGGQKAIEELTDQTKSWYKNDEIKTKHFPVQIAFNVIPQCDSFLDNGYTKEEMKMVNETKKILESPDMKITATCVRVPVFRAHSEAIWIETEKIISEKEVTDLLKKSPGLIVQDKNDLSSYPTPLEISKQYATHVGRIRKDISNNNGITFWVVSDQLIKGAALNAIQIAELF